MTENRDNLLSFRPGDQTYLAGPEQPYFCFSATLRVFGDQLDLDAITSALETAPTSFHRKGERRSPRSPEFKHDMWCLESPLSEDEPLGRHLEWLYENLSLKFDYLISLKESAAVDIFCGYRSNSATAGFSVEHQALKIFEALDVPFDVSVIVLEDE